MKNSGLTLNEFKALFLAEFAPLCLFANSYLHDQQASKDVVQDVFIKVWEKGVYFSSNSAAKSYLYTAVKNKAIDTLRSTVLRNTDKETALEKLSIDNSDDKFYQEVISVETIRLLQKAISSLPQKCAAIINLSLKEYTNEEIATELGISINTVKTQKKIGYKKLKELLQWHVVLFLSHLQNSSYVIS
ncbi:RNA polymerase sigma-70 factor [Zhouia sp. PK063]|uniref:RNA polymerase sigma-70 factor n=1 Tax=Zhouia sp. PK063 TaxID=3373602 RepID=UPI00378E0471